jgi:hypothetical protein
MMLGDLLAEVERAANAGDATALLGDLSLMTRVAAATADGGIDPDAYVVAAVRRFEQGASPEDWVSLMGAASRHADPGKVCLQRMVHWALQRDRLTECRAVPG